MLQHPLSGGSAHERLFVQYDDGVQMDSVIFVAADRPGLPPNAVALLDRDDALATLWEPPIFRTNTKTDAEWAFLGWVALGNLVKYCARGSLWEALSQLEEARTMAWRLWASQHQVGYPLFGVTSVLDAPEIGVPPGIDKTVAILDREAILSAAAELAVVLQRVAGQSHPGPMADWVRSQMKATALT
jgi:hypothetical protein